MEKGRLKNEYAKLIRFRGEGETNKEAETRIKRINKLRNSLIGNKKPSFAYIVRKAVDHYLAVNGF